MIKTFLKQILLINKNCPLLIYLSIYLSLLDYSYTYLNRQFKTCVNRLLRLIPTRNNLHLDLRRNYKMYWKLIFEFSSEVATYIPASPANSSSHSKRLEFSSIQLPLPLAFGSWFGRVTMASNVDERWFCYLLSVH